MQIETVENPEALARWQAFAQQQTNEPVRQTGILVDMLAESYPVCAVRLAALDPQGEPVAAACGYHHKRAGAGVRLFVPRFGIAAAGQSGLNALLQGLGEYARMNGMVQSVIALPPHSGQTTAMSWKKTTMVTPLAGTGEEILGSYRGKTRNSVRKALKHFKVASGPDFVEAFHSVYAGRMTDKRINNQSLDFLRRIIEANAGVELFVARRDGDIHAGMVFLHAGTKAFYLFNGATPEGLSLCANHLLMWHAMAHYSSLGVTVLDMGESTPNTGVYEFKSYFGGTAEEIDYCDVLNSPDRPLQSAGAPLSQRIESRLARYLPSAPREALLRRRRAFERLL